MRYRYDPKKRSETLQLRGLDLKDAGQVFEGFYLSRADKKHSQKEERIHTLGLLNGEVILVVWTPRDGERRIITMWKANEREREKYHEQRDRFG